MRIDTRCIREDAILVYLVHDRQTPAISTEFHDLSKLQLTSNDNGCH